MFTIHVPLHSVAVTKHERQAWTQWWPYTIQDENGFAVMCHQQTFPNNWYISDHLCTHLKLLRNKPLLPFFFCCRYTIISERKNEAPKAPETLIANNLTARRKAAWGLSENWVQTLTSTDESNHSIKNSKPLVWGGIHLHHSTAPAAWPVMQNWKHSIHRVSSCFCWGFPCFRKEFGIIQWKKEPCLLLQVL